MKTFRILAAAAAAADLVVAATVGATAPVPSRSVAYSDLKLGTVDGRRTLDRRIDLAARAVCSRFGSPIEVETSMCRADARDRALADLGRAGIVL